MKTKGNMQKHPNTECRPTKSLSESKLESVLKCWTINVPIISLRRFRRCRHRRCRCCRRCRRRRRRRRHRRCCHGRRCRLLSHFNSPTWWCWWYFKRTHRLIIIGALKKIKFISFQIFGPLFRHKRKYSKCETFLLVSTSRLISTSVLSKNVFWVWPLIPLLSNNP